MKCIDFCFIVGYLALSTAGWRRQWPDHGEQPLHRG